MAALETRAHKSGKTHRVVWREDGRRQQQTFATLKQAQQFKLRVEAEGNHWPRGWIPGVGFEDDLPSSAPLFAEYAEKTINARQKADERTKADYKRILHNHINPILGELNVDRIDRFQVAEVSHVMQAAGKSAKTISNAHALMSSILTDAVTDRLIDRNPAVGAMPSLPDSKTEEMAFLSPAEFALLLEHVAERYRPLVRLLAGTGLRWAEATALKVSDVDLHNRQALDVRRAWKRRGNTFVLGAPKTNRSRRSVGLSPELVATLASVILERDPDEFVFVTEWGRPVMHNNFFNRVWKPAVVEARRAGLTKAPRIHDLRHSHASWLLEDKVSLVAIQRRLGHESITTTIDRYSHLAPDHVEEISASVDRVLRIN